LLVTYSHRFDLSTLAIIVPLLVVSYLTFRTAMGRVEDSSNHLSELNTLYLSTIETLAMAIDAKDQVTHGHIRRVQTYATGLARHVGIKEERLLKAIEAAALLHDMGKLAVPEYILNKPGKLTTAEFDKMKLHASVGADILSAIDFPYPVVPIVRHHHENWDGTGYPAGLRGTDIPIGARILSVVDCFDALTSDRPYRPRLSDSEALNILMQRRGGMYDPLVVDTFVKVHDLIAPAPLASGPSPRALDEIASARKAVPPTLRTPILDGISASVDETLTLHELVRDLSAQVSLIDAADISAKHLRRLISCSLCVFFVVDEGTGELEARHATGEGASLVKGLRVPLGQRLSGWVAANRQTIINSDPVLDFGDTARPHALSLRSCLCTPLAIDEDLVGVLSIYSGEPTGFNEDHRRIIEAVAREAARAFRRSVAFDHSTKRDPLMALPNFNRLIELVGATSRARSEHALLYVTIDSIGKAAAPLGSGAAHNLLIETADTVRGHLRQSDSLFYHGGERFIVLLPDTPMLSANAIGLAIRDKLIHQTVRTASGILLKTEATVSVACSAFAAGSPFGICASLLRNDGEGAAHSLSAHSLAHCRQLLHANPGIRSSKGLKHRQLCKNPLCARQRPA
jgi:putative nucleotidyltransferase with HDIG domain